MISPTTNQAYTSTVNSARVPTCTGSRRALTPCTFAMCCSESHYELAPCVGIGRSCAARKSLRLLQ